MLSTLLCSCAMSGDINISHYYVKGLSDNWNVQGGNERRDGVFETELKLPLELRWKERQSSALTGVITAEDGLVYFSTMDGRVLAYELSTGDRIGSIKYLYAAMQGISLYRQHAIFGLSSGKDNLIKYDLYYSRYKFIKEIGPVETNPLPVQDYIYVGTSSGIFYCISQSDGETSWKKELRKPIHSSPAIAANIVLFGCDDGALYAVDRFKGSDIWKHQTQAAIMATPVTDRENVYIGSTDGTFAAINLKSGVPIWRFKIGLETPGQFFSAAAVNDIAVFVGGTDGTLYALRKTDGALFWKFQTGGAISVAPIIAGNQVWLGSQDRHIYALDINSGKSLWSYELEGRIKTNFAIFGPYLIVASENNKVYTFRTKP